MDNQIPGPICSSRLGPDWIDKGTMCRSRSGTPGPLRLLMSLVLGAAPVAGRTAENDKKQETVAMMHADILAIANSGFGRTREGRAIVSALQVLNNSGKIEYAETFGEGRGDWDGETLRVNENYRGKMYPTILELVHEASHALWRKDHPKKANDRERREDDIADELHAEENQLIVYKFLKQTKGYEDQEMEQRLQRQAGGTLRQTIAQRYDEAKAGTQGSN